MFFEDFEESLYFDVAKSVDDDCLLMLVASADGVLVYGFYGVYFFWGDGVLSECVLTSNYFLNSRQAGSYWSLLVLVQRSRVEAENYEFRVASIFKLCKGLEVGI